MYLLVLFFTCSFVEVVESLPPIAQYTESENQQIERMLKRLEKLGQCSRDRSVTLMVDAEQSYYQPAIRHLTIDHLMPQFNTDRAVIYNTQQCYLKVCLLVTVCMY